MASRPFLTGADDTVIRRDRGRLAVLVGTHKGLFRFTCNASRLDWQIEGPFIPGYEILHVWLDPRNTQTGYAAANHPIWGSHIYRSRDYGRTWTSLVASPCHRSGEFSESLKSIWYLAPGAPTQPSVIYAGIDPPGLFVSDDAGESWSPVSGLNRHPTRERWEPARGGFAVHSIYVVAENPARMYAAVSAGGAFRSIDGGESWVPINRGVRAENLPIENPEAGHNVHRLLALPGAGDRLYRQCYNGTYRSDDGGDSWNEISAGLPSDFGYPIVAAPNTPDTVYVVPEEGNHMRTTVDGRLRVYRSRDAGTHWSALTRGLPQQNAYVSVLREAMCCDEFTPHGVYLGTTSGHLFASRDEGENWSCLAAFLPRILCVSASLVESS